MRWLAELASFNFTIQHIPGKETTATDALSRSTHMTEPTEEEVQEVEEYVRSIDPVEEDLEDIQLNHENLLRAQTNDPTMVKSPSSSIFKASKYCK